MVYHSNTLKKTLDYSLIDYIRLIVMSDISYISIKRSLGGHIQFHYLTKRSEG